MTADRWRRIESLFDRVADLPPAEQERTLLIECGADRELFDELTRLLRHDRAADSSIGNAVAVAISGLAALEAPPEPDYAGQRVGPYRVLREVGRGGMGVVFEAVRDDDQFRQRVALKISARAPFAPQFRERFRHERQILAQLEHPHIARLLDGGATGDGVPFFAMEFVEGEPIQEFVERRGLPVPERLRLFLQVCDAVEYAHQRLVIHRDLKPGNILVAAGSAKLLDFGIAKLVEPGAGDLTHTGMVPLTPDYCSPEQVRGQPVTTRTDVYALGLVLYELLTGERAQRANSSSPLELDRSVCETSPSPPSVRAAQAGQRALAKRLAGDLDTIVLKAAHKDPERRYASAAALAEDVLRHLDGRPILARLDSRWYRVRKFVRRRWLPLAAASLLLASLGAGVLATRYQAGRAERRFAQTRRIANALLADIHPAIRDLAGSAKAQDLVVRTAIEYLDALAREAANDRSLQLEIARGYLRVAEVRFTPGRPSAGRPDEARQMLDKAQGLLDGLLRDAPDDASVAAAAAALHYSRGALLTNGGDAPGSLAELERAVAVAERALPRNPENQELLEELAEALRLTVTGHGASGAGPRYAPRYLEIAERAARAAPVTASSLANRGIAYSQVGRILLHNGNTAEALQFFERNVALQQQAVALEPDNTTGRSNLMIGWSNIGDLKLGPLGPGEYPGSGGPAAVVDAGQRRDALAAYGKALEQAEWRYRRDAADPNIRFDYAMALGRRAPAFPPGDPEAIRSLEQCLALLADPQPAWADGFVIEFHGSLAERRRQAGEFGPAVGHWRAVESRLARAVAARPGDHAARRTAVTILQNWATELARRGNRTEALQVARRAVAVADELAALEKRYARGPGWPPRVRGWLATLHESLGDQAAARRARAESRDLWKKLATRTDLPPDLRNEAARAAQ